MSDQGPPTPMLLAPELHTSRKWGEADPAFFLREKDGIPAPPGGLPVELQPDIWLYRQVFDPLLCKHIIGKFESDSRKTRTGSAPEGGDHAYRRGERLYISGRTRPEWTEEDAAVHRGFERVIMHHFLSHRYPLDAMQHLEDSGYDITCYRTAEDGCAIHADGGFDMRRALSAIVYLNTLTEGGETFFPRWNLEVKPEAGSVLIFPPGHTHFHGARGSRLGPRYIILTWVNHKPKQGQGHSHDGLPPHTH